MSRLSALARVSSTMTGDAWFKTTPAESPMSGLLGVECRISGFDGHHHHHHHHHHECHLCLQQCRQSHHQTGHMYHRIFRRLDCKCTAAMCAEHSGSIPRKLHAVFQTPKVQRKVLRSVVLLVRIDCKGIMQQQVS